MARLFGRLVDSAHRESQINLQLRLWSGVETHLDTTPPKIRLTQLDFNFLSFFYVLYFFSFLFQLSDLLHHGYVYSQELMKTDWLKHTVDDF